nr:CopD family protein [uncultured Enterobacter sp.]
MDHQLLNVIHLISGMIWLGGLILMAVVACAASKNRGTNSAVELLVGNVLSWSRSVTSPAMVILWACGIAMIVSHGGDIPLWLILKIVVLLLLSGLHGFLSATLRKMSGGAVPPARAIVRIAPVIIIIAVALVVILAKLGHSL